MHFQGLLLTKKVLGNTYSIQKLEMTLNEEDEFNMAQELAIYLIGISLMYLAREMDQMTGPKDRIQVDEIGSDTDSDVKMDIERLAMILEES